MAVDTTDEVAAGPAPGRETGLPPGPSWPVAVQTAMWQFRFEQFATWCSRKYGSFFTVQLPISRTTVSVSDPDAIKAVFADRGDRMHAGKGNSILEPALGRYSILLLDGPEHARQRRLVHPPFHGSRMQRYGEIIAAATNEQIDSWPVGQPFPLRPSMQALTLRVILRAVFGLEEGASMHHIETLVRRVISPAGSPLAIMFLRQRDVGPLKLWSRFVADREELDRALYAEIHRRREAGDLAQRDDILSILLQARDDEGQPMRDVELRDELMTLLLAGHETTATALSWFFEMVLRDRRVLTRLREEARAGETRYLDATVSEVMRLRPVIAMVARKLQQDLGLGGFMLPKGTVVAPSIYLTHRRADLYPEPLAFRPERFLDNRLESYAWLPFGGGIRRCVGADFALYEMRVAIPEILRRVDLEPASAQPERIRRQAVTMVPSHGARVVARAKRPAD